MAKTEDENWDDRWDSDSDAVIPEEDEFAELDNKEFAARYFKFLGDSQGAQ
jgi:hypothetical protein